MAKVLKEEMKHMNLQEKMKMLEDLIEKISNKGHDESLLQQLIRCYFDIYLAKDYQKLGDCIDVFQNCTSVNLDSNFFGKIIKTGKDDFEDDNNLGYSFANRFRASFVHTIIKHNESLKQIYTSLGVLDNDQEEAKFWWGTVVNAITDFDFEDLCKVMPNRNISSDCYFICEKDLRILLMEKGIPEDNYTIDYGTMYGGRVLVVGDPLDDFIIEEFKKQKQKGLRIVRKTRKETVTT